MKKQRLGTHVPSLSDATGGLVDDLGSPLINTNTEGGSAQTLGATLRRELVAGVANGDFSIPPAKPTSALPNEDDDNDNSLPFWTLVSPGNGVVAKLVQASSAASGYELRFTIKPGASNGTAGGDGHTHYLERYLPVAASRARSFIYQPRTTWSCSSGASSANVSIWAEAQYFTREEAAIGSATTGSLAITGLSQEVGLQPSAVAVEGDAGFLRYRTGITVTGAISTTETATIREIRMSSGEVQAIFADQSAPGSNRGSISLNNARLTTSVAGGAGASAYLDATATSSPSSRGIFSFDTATPIGATYSDGTAVSVPQSTVTKLNLGASPDAGAVLGNPASNEVTPPAGLYLVIANGFFATEAGGKYRRIRIYKNATAGAGVTLPNMNAAAPDNEISVSSVVSVNGTDTLSARADHDHGTAINATCTEFSLIRLGAAW
jgi:hypothetical protein